MIHQLTIPPTTPGVVEIRVLEWHIQPGGEVAEGDLVVELETHKAVIEVRAAQAGYLRQVFAQAGDWKTIGVPLAIFSTAPEEELPADCAGSAEMQAHFEIT